MATLWVSKSSKMERPSLRKEVFRGDCAPKPPRGTPWLPKWTPRATQRHPNGRPRVPQDIQNAPFWHPSEPQERLKTAQKSPQTLQQIIKKTNKVSTGFECIPCDFNYYCYYYCCYTQARWRVRSFAAHWIEFRPQCNILPCLIV